MPLFDYDLAGRSIVMADGDEVLVHDGASEGPLWRHTLGSRLVGVASTEPAIVTLDDRGTLTFFDAPTGAQTGCVDTGRGARALAALPDGTCAVLARGQVSIADDAGVHRRLDAGDATCVAFSTDGMICTGAPDGTILIFTDTDTPFQEERLDAPIGAIAWHPGGFWVVGAGAAVYRVDPAGVERITGAPDAMPIGALACAPSGHVAVRMGEQTVVVFAYPSRETDASMSWFDRQVTDIVFGPDDWLGIGLDKGDGNKINLATGATHRTDTHPGRTHNSWALSVSTGKARASGALDQGDAVPVNQAPESSRSDMLVGIIAVVVIAAVIYMLLT